MDNDKCGKLQATFIVIINILNIATEPMRTYLFYEMRNYNGILDNAKKIFCCFGRNKSQIST